MTLDLDFANIRAYPPNEHAGIVVLRVKHQDKMTVLIHVRRLMLALARRNPTGELWIVDGNRIRFRQSHSTYPARRDLPGGAAPNAISSRHPK